MLDEDQAHLYLVVFLTFICFPVGLLVYLLWYRNSEMRHRYAFFLLGAGLFILEIWFYWNAGY